MRYRCLHAFVVLVTLGGFPSGLQAQAGGSVSGMILGRFEAQVRPLPFAAVEAWGPGLHRTLMADSTGHYQLTELPAGALRIRATHPGHDPLEVDVVVPADGDALVDLELRARPVELPAVDVTTDVRLPDADRRTVAAEAETAGRVEAAALEIGSGAVDAGLAEAVRAFGGNDPAQATDVLFMRGSTTDLKLVLLDGAPVYTPFHVAGLLRSFEPSVLGRADLHVGGAPARYDGGLTYILDLRTRRPRRDRLHASGSLDLLSGSAALDAPLGSRGGVVASARSLHPLGDSPLGASPYGYRDALLGLEVEPAPGHLIRTTGFWNRESVVLDLPGTLGVSAGLAPDEAWWSNRAASATYVGRAGGFFLEGTAAASGYDATLPLQPSAPEGEPEPAPLLASAHTRRFRSTMEAARPVSWGMVRFGLSGERTDAAFSTDPIGSGAPPQEAASQSTTVGGYIDVSRSLASGVTLRAGLRADRFSGDGAPRLAPRAALTWEVGPQALVTVATGRYHQNARADDGAVEESLTDNVGANRAPVTLLPVATADHVVVSLEQTLGEDVRLGVAGFWKGYQGLRPGSAEAIQSSGLDLRVQHMGERTTAWLGYGLSWYWSGTDLSGSSSTFTGRQLLTAGLSGSLGSTLGAEVNVAYGAGLPYTSVPFHSLSPSAAEADRNALENSGDVIEETPPFPGGLGQDFLRIDVEIHATLRPTWGGHRWEVRPYVRVLNALDRRDALFYAFQPWRGGGVTPLAERPLVPVLGVAWRF